MNIGEKPVILCNNIAVLHKKGTILCSRKDVWPLRVLPDLIRHLTLSCVFYRIVWDCGSKPAKTLHQGSAFTHKRQSLELALVEFGNIFHSLTLCAPHRTHGCSGMKMMLLFLQTRLQSLLFLKIMRNFGAYWNNLFNVNGS